MLSVGLHCDQDSGTETMSEVVVVMQMNVIYALAMTDLPMSVPDLTEVVLNAIVHLSV